ncbi:Alpha/Beta hydrolase protein [Mrakia frigida]|uniref:alpha/beta hydrolase n=1 Tax=Mrakia frigida TaxID=29902 RepID=UPI003FCC0789
MEPATRLPTSSPATTYRYKEIENVVEGGVHLDLYLPKEEQCVRGSPCPVAVFYHGGSWVMGSATDVQPRQIDWFLARGIAVASVEYRLAPQVHVEDALVDCLDGYRFVLEKLPSLVQDSWPVGTEKGITLDPKRVVVVGFSAGAHLAICMVCRTGGVDQPPSPLAVLSFYGMTALEYGSYGKPEDWEGLRKVKPKEVGFAELVFEGKVASRVPILHQPIPPPLTSRRTYLGLAMHLDSLFSLIAPPLPPATTVDPQRKHFSPWYYVDATFPPTFLSWGDQDTLVRPRQSIVFRDKLEELGVECGWAIAKGASHGYAEKDFVESRPGAIWWEEAILPGLEFVVNKLDGKPGASKAIVELDEKLTSSNGSVEVEEVGIETKVGA